MTDTDFRLLHEKLDRFEQKLKELEVEIKALKPNQPWQSDDPSAPYYRPIYTAYQQGAVLERKCFFDNLSPEDRMKPMGVSCPCPKCTPYSMS